MASATVAFSGSATYSVFIKPPAEFSLYSSSSSTSALGSAPFLAGFLRRFAVPIPRARRPLRRGHFFDDVGGLLGFERLQDAGLNIGLDLGERFGGHFMVDGFEDGFAIVGAQIFHDVGQVRRVHLLQHLVADVETQSPLRIGFDDAAMLPGDGVRGNERLHAANPAGRNGALRQPPEDAAQSDVDVDDADGVAIGFVLDLKCNVGYPDHLAPLPVDDLLVEQIADQAQHVLVGMIGVSCSSLR